MHTAIDTNGYFGDRVSDAELGRIDPRDAGHQVL